MDKHFKPDNTMRSLSIRNKTGKFREGTRALAGLGMAIFDSRNEMRKLSEKFGIRFLETDVVMAAMRAGLLEPANCQQTDNPSDSRGEH